MIEVRMGHQHEVDFRQIMNFEPRLLEPLDHFQPFRPDRIDQEIELVGLDQERSVPDPGDPHFAFADFRELRTRMIAGTLGEERRDQDFRKEIALVPVRAWNKADPGGTFAFRAVPGRLANDVPPAFFRKRNRHGGPSI